MINPRRSKCGWRMKLYGLLKNISVCKDYLLTAKDGKNYSTKLYNLDVIISVGYRVKSQRGTQFRIWAKNGSHFQR